MSTQPWTKSSMTTYNDSFPQNRDPKSNTMIGIIGGNPTDKVMKDGWALTEDLIVSIFLGSAYPLDWSGLVELVALVVF